MQSAFKRLQLLFLYVGGLAIVGQMFFLQEYTWDVEAAPGGCLYRHGDRAALLLCRFLAGIAVALGGDFNGCRVYRLRHCRDPHPSALSRSAQAWPGVLSSDASVPAKFPILIVVPALALDLLWQRVKNWKPWQIALVSGVLFIAVLTAVEWNFAKFLLSDASKNRFFGTIYFQYNSRADWLRPLAAVVSSRSRVGSLRRSVASRCLRFHLRLARSAVRPLDAWCAAMKLWRSWFTLLLSLALVLPAHAHIGSKDVYEQVNAGPYKLFVTIRTPNVIPGVATIEVRSSGAAVSSIRITPTPLTGEASKHPPSSDAMKPSADDPAFFTGSLWLMAPGSWQVHFDIDGAAGKASSSVPVPAMPLSILPMQRPLGIMLAVLGILLMIGIVGIVAAAVGQSRLEPWRGWAAQPRAAGRWSPASSPWRSPLLIVYGGYKWWNVEATAYAADIYHPLSLSPTLSGNTLDLKIGRYDSDTQHTFRARSNDDLLPDHGHLMHLYAIRQPEMDAVFHLHPALVSARRSADDPALHACGHLPALRGHCSCQRLPGNPYRRADRSGEYAACSAGGRRRLGCAARAVAG